MLRLTLRSHEDARFLARVIERDGFAFVLDYGDPSTIADVSERVSRGFSVFHDGTMRSIAPGSNELLHRLADYYEQAGLLVKLDEQHLGSMVPQPSPFGDNTPAPSPLEDSLRDQTYHTLNDDPDDETELVPIDVPVGEQVTVIRKKIDRDEETLRLELPVTQRRMWSPPVDPDASTLDLALESIPPVASTEAREDEETELVPLDMRRRAIEGDAHTSDED